MQDRRIRRPSWTLAVSLCLASFVAGALVGQPIANPIVRVARTVSERFTATLHASNAIKGYASEPEIRIVVLEPRSELAVGAPPAPVNNATLKLAGKTTVRHHNTKRMKPADSAARVDPGNPAIQMGETVE